MAQSVSQQNVSSPDCDREEMVTANTNAAQSQNPESTIFGHSVSDPGILMNHVTNATPQNTVGNIRIGPVSFQRRTVDGTRLFRENFQHVFQEIRPLVEQARSNNTISNLLNRQVTQHSNSDSNIVMATPNTSNANNDYVINVDGNDASTSSNPVRHQSAPETNFFGPQNSSNNNNNNPEDSVTAEALRQVPEARAMLETLQRYIPFLMILLAKAIYDHREGILNLIALFITFTHANSVVKREVGKQARRSIASLLIVLVYIFACMVFINYIFHDEKLYPSLVFLPPYTRPLNVWELLWTVCVSDFMLKLITIMLKILITSLPAAVLAFQRRGKVYLTVESISQLYRSLLPIQPWLWFLLDSYQGAERITGVLLSAAYMVAKGADLASKLRMLKMAIVKLIQNVSIGTAATKEQLRQAAEQCPICHDTFTSPVALQPCQHVFCEACASAWLDREPTCPLCRATVSDDPAWRDGSTTFFMQLY